MSSDSSLWLCSKDISTTRAVFALPVDENLALRASLLACLIPAAHPGLFCHVSYAYSLADHFRKV